MDTVLGVSMAPTGVRMVLVEGENGDGALVEDEKFDVDDDPNSGTYSAAEQVISAILGTREGAAEGGYQLASTGVTWHDPDQAAALRDALAYRKVENVMLVSAFLAAAALAHSVGNETHHAQTALLFIEPDTATLAVVDSADGSITDIHRQPLPEDDDAAVARLAELVSGAEQLRAHPDAVFVVGSGVDVPMIKPTLEAATSLPVTVPDEPETALAMGAALASANAPLLAAPTAARAYAQDLGTGAHQPYGLDPVYFENAESGALAYSAVEDDHDDRKPFALLGSILVSIFIIGVASLVVSLAVSIRSTSGTRPDPGQAIVVPNEQAPAAPPQAPAPAPELAPARAPDQVPAQAPVPEQVPVPQAPAAGPQAPADVPQAPAPLPDVPAPVPAPVPAAPAPLPVPIPIPLIPPIFTPQVPFDPPGRGGNGPPGIGQAPAPKFPGGGGGRGPGGKGPGKGPGGGGGRGGFNIPGIPGI